jgi:hypothetical protein
MRIVETFKSVDEAAERATTRMRLTLLAVEWHFNGRAV